MATLASIRTALSERAGATLDSTFANRLINESYAEVFGAARWPWRIRTKSVNIASGAAQFSAGAEVDDIIGLKWSNGSGNDVVLSEWHPDTWQDLFEGDKTTAANATDFAVLHTGATANDNFDVHIWPVLSSSGTYNLRYAARAVDLSSDSQEPDMPDDTHYLVTLRALAKYFRHEDDPQADAVEADYRQKLQAKVQYYGGEIIVDGT